MSERQKAKTITAAFDIDAVAELICVHRSTVERLLESRKLGFYEIGRRRVIGQIHLDQYLAQLSGSRAQTASDDNLFKCRQ